METKLPPLFDSEDYAGCLLRNHKFCKAVSLLNIPSDSTLSKIFKDINQDVKNFNRSFIHRGLCVPKTINNESVESHISNLIGENIKNYDVTQKVDSYMCLDREMHITAFDNLVLIGVIAYLIFVLFATYQDLKSRKNSTTKGLESTLINFSLMKNWEKRTSLSKNEDYQRLLNIQGFRFFTMLFIIVEHVFMNFGWIYLDNPETYEMVMHLEVVEIYKFLCIVVVLNFFVISTWLLTLQAYNVYEKHGRLSLKHVGIIIINRYFRLSVSIFVIFLINTSWMKLLEGPFSLEFLNMTQKSCRENWLYNFLYLNNFLFIEDMCNLISWYLAADFQMYVLNAFFIYVVFKFKSNELKVYSMIVIMCCIVQALNIYVHDLDVVFRADMRNMELRAMKRSRHFLYSYTSTSAVASSSAVGMIFGAIYYKTKEVTLQNTKLVSSIWLTLFLGLPVLSFLLAIGAYTDLIRPLIGSIIDPLYCLGIGVGMLGMSHDLGGYIRKFLENKYVVLLSNFSFSTYVCHGIFVFTWQSHAPFNFNFFALVSNVVSVVIVSIATGIVVTLTIEEPGLYLQKKMLPQIERKRSIVGKNE